MVATQIWLIDDEVVGADLTRPFAELLTMEAQLDLHRPSTVGTRRSALSDGSRWYPGPWAVALTCALNGHTVGFWRIRAAHDPLLKS